MSLKRVLSAGFLNFWRNGFVTLSSLLVMTLTLIVIGSLVFLGAILNSSLEQIKSKVDVNVYFVTNAAEPDILSLKRSLEGLPEVKLVEYISREQALEAFRARHESDQLTLQALDELGENPLGAVLNIEAKDPSQYESIARFLESDSALGQSGAQLIDKVNFFQEEHRLAIERLTAIIASGQKIGFAVAFFFLLMAALILFNTIRLAIYTSREEISVMRLVGANNAYIRSPFIVEGLLYGFVSSIVALLFFFPATYWLGETTADFFGGINVFSYYVSNFGFIFLLIAGSGLLLGALASAVAVRRYLKI